MSGLAPAAAPGTSSRTADARLVVAVTGVFCMFAAPADPSYVLPLALAAAAAACLWLVLRARPAGAADDASPSDGAASARRDRLVAIIVVASSGFCGVLAGALVSGPLAAAGAGAAYALLAHLATSPARSRPAVFAVLALLHAALMVTAIVTLHVRIDVAEFIDGGLDALLHGTSPYAITIRDVYGPVESALYYGPGVVEDGRVLYGYPYLPSTLLLDLPGVLLGDVRFVHLAAMLAVAAYAWWAATDRLGRLLAVVLLTSPTATVVLLAHWIEPLMSLLLVLVAAALLRAPGWVALPLGLLLSSKQYLVAVLPSLWVVVRRAGWSRAAAGCAVAAVVIGVFFLWDPPAFVRSAVELQLRQPFRDDAVSLLPLLADVTGPLPSWLLGVLPIGVGLLVSVLVVRRLRAGATAYLLATGLPLLCTVLLSKQAFSNYYSFIGTALLAAAVLWPVDDPMAEEDAPVARSSDQLRR
jgi:hypothetical protein